MRLGTASKSSSSSRETSRTPVEVRLACFKMVKGLAETSRLDHAVEGLDHHRLVRFAVDFHRESERSAVVVFKQDIAARDEAFLVGDFERDGFVTLSGFDLAVLGGGAALLPHDEAERDSVKRVPGGGGGVSGHRTEGTGSVLRVDVSGTPGSFFPNRPALGYFKAVAGRFDEDVSILQRLGDDFLGKASARENKR